jgi:hypothetical protein
VGEVGTVRFALEKYGDPLKVCAQPKLTMAVTASDQKSFSNKQGGGGISNTQFSFDSDL